MGKGEMIKYNQMTKSKKIKKRASTNQRYGLLEGGNVLFRDGTGAGGSFSRNGPKRRYVDRNTHQ